MPLAQHQLSVGAALGRRIAAGALVVGLGLAVALPSAVAQDRPAPKSQVLTERFPLDGAETAPRAPAPPATSEPATPSRAATPPAPAPAAEPAGDSSGGSVMLAVIIGAVALLAVGLVGGRALRRRWLRNSEPPIPPWRGSRPAPDGRAGVAAMQARVQPRRGDPGIDAVNARVSPPEVPPVSQPDAVPIPPSPAPPAPVAAARPGRRTRRQGGAQPCPAARRAARARRGPGPLRPIPPRPSPRPRPRPPTSRSSRRLREAPLPVRASTTTTRIVRCPTSPSSARPTAPAGPPMRSPGWGTATSRPRPPPSRRAPRDHPGGAAAARGGPTSGGARPPRPRRDPGSDALAARIRPDEAQLDAAARALRSRTPPREESERPEVFWSARERVQAELQAAAAAAGEAPPPAEPGDEPAPEPRPRSLAAGVGARDRDAPPPTGRRGGPGGGHPRIPLGAQGPARGIAGGGAGPRRVTRLGAARSDLPLRPCGRGARA